MRIPRGRVYPLMVVLSLLVIPVGARGQGSRSDIEGRLAALRVGSWIQIEGASQADGSVLCGGLSLLTGDFFDDDWSLKGMVRAIDASRNQLNIGGWSVHVDENTRFEGRTGTLEGLSDLRPGMLVEVEGTYVRSRGFLAQEVDDESDELAIKPALKDRVMIVGRIEGVDPRRHSIEAMGVTFRLSERARIRSVIE